MVGLSFNIEQTPTGGVNVTVQPAGGIQGEVRVNGVSHEVPATESPTPRRSGNRGGAGASSSTPNAVPDMHRCTVKGCKDKRGARTKGFKDLMRLAKHVLTEHSGSTLASTFREEGWHKVKGQSKVKKKKPEKAASKKVETEVKKEKRKTKTPFKQQPPSRAEVRQKEPVQWAPNLFAQSPTAQAAARRQASEHMDGSSDSDSDSESVVSDDGLGSDTESTKGKEDDIAQTEDEDEGEDVRPRPQVDLVDDSDAWETVVKLEPEDVAEVAMNDPVETEPAIVEPEPRVEKPNSRVQSPKSEKKMPQRTPKKAETPRVDPPCLEPVSDEIHPFAADAPQIHGTYADDGDSAFTSLALRCLRSRMEGDGRNWGRGRKHTDETAPATKFSDATEYASYHRLLVLEDCASGAADEFKLNRLVTRWKVANGFTSAAALTNAAKVEGLFSVVMNRDRKAENTASDPPTEDDIVEVKYANAESVIGVVDNISPDGNTLSVSVRAADLLGAEALKQGAEVTARTGYSLTTTRREFHAVQDTVQRLHAPLVAPLLLGQPFYTGWNNGSTAVTGKALVPGTKQQAMPLPMALGNEPKNLSSVNRVIEGWCNNGTFNANQASAIRRCIRPGVVSGAETIRPCMGVALLHGPPGTGKTNTLVGVVSALLLCSPKPRILLCAPSNAAIDELALRMVTGLLDKDGKKCRMKEGQLVRVGPIDQVSHRMHPHALNTLVDARMDGLVGRRTKKEEDRQRKATINSAQIVAATTSAAGGAYLTESGMGFDCVIIDEAAQASEAATLIPLRHSGGKEQLEAKRLILVGDHMQLPTTAHAEDPSLRKAYAMSLFQRLEASHPAVALTVQHRMHAEIAKWPAKYFYRSELENAADSPTESPFNQCGGDGAVCLDGHLFRLKPYAFLDFHGEEAVGAQSKSIMNESEAKVVAAVVKAARRWARVEASVAVITPYREQRELIIKYVDDSSVRVGTVDGFQGQEADIVIISCTRTKQLGFLEDERRLNVALTRARESLLIVGSADFMRRKRGPWKDLVDDAHERGCLHPVVPAGPEHPNGRRVSIPDYESCVLKRKAETQERALNLDVAKQLELAKKSKAAGGKRPSEASSQLAAKKNRIAADVEAVKCGPRVHKFEPNKTDRQARQPQHPQQQQYRKVVKTSPAQKRREKEERARNERNERRVLQEKLAEERRREEAQRRDEDRRHKDEWRRRHQGGVDLRDRLGGRGPHRYDERNYRRPDNTTRGYDRAL